MRRRALALAVVLATAVGSAAAQAPQHPHGHAPSPSGGHDHGAPDGWKFTLPTGDPEKGREAFVKLGCHACHPVKGQRFPGAAGAGDVGPELSEMAAHHEPEFFAEAIVNPNAVIDDPHGRAADGTSKMPSFNEVMTVQELIDLVAFLRSLAPPGGHRR